MLDAFSKRAPFSVRIERAQRPRGHAGAFLRAAEMCEGDLVAFCDQDDVWGERKLEVCAGFLERFGATLALHTTRVVDSDLRETAPPWPPIRATRLIPPLAFSGPHLDAPGMAMVFRRSLLDLADPSERPPSRYSSSAKMVHDEWLQFLAGVVGPIQLIAEPLVLYRQHDENVSGPVERRRLVTLAPVVEEYRAVASYSAGCASFLETLRHDDPTIAARLEAGARHYRRIADRWELRTSLYCAGSRRVRAHAVARLLAARAYGPRAAGGFGPRALGKDVVAGVGLRATA
jgi:glycosyltransferase involved in cell wall biosynthesis